jgi:hypothetical protein
MPWYDEELTHIGVYENEDAFHREAQEADKQGWEVRLIGPGVEPSVRSTTARVLEAHGAAPAGAGREGQFVAMFVRNDRWKAIPEHQSHLARFEDMLRICRTRQVKLERGWNDFQTAQRTLGALQDTVVAGSAIDQLTAEREFLTAVHGVVEHREMVIRFRTEYISALREALGAGAGDMSAELTGNLEMLELERSAAGVEHELQHRQEAVVRAAQDASRLSADIARRRAELEQSEQHLAEESAVLQAGLARRDDILATVSSLPHG